MSSMEGSSTVPSRIFPHKDWTEEIRMTPIRDQRYCSCCWAIASVGAVESAYQILFKEYVHLSVQELIDYNEPSSSEEKPEEKKYDSAGCFPFSINRALQYIIRHGISPEAEYPFKAKRGPPKALNSGSKKFIQSFYQIPNGDEESLMEAVNRQPVAAALNVYRGLTTLKSEIYMGPKYHGDQLLGTHCVLIIGYGTQIVKKRNKKGKSREGPVHYWLIKNGWGEKWGAKGYAKVCRKVSLPPGSESLFYRCSVPVIQGD